MRVSKGSLFKWRRQGGELGLNTYLRVLVVTAWAARRPEVVVAV